MLIFDQLKKSDPQLRLLSFAVLSGLCVLLAGLWWVQVVSARDYQTSMETQSVRTVRLPAPRGKIFDRNGNVLAENRPTYNIGLYLEDLSEAFRSEYKRLRPIAVVTNSLPFWKKWLGSSRVETQYVRLDPVQRQSLERQARYNVTSNAVQRIATLMGQPLTLDATAFHRHYESQRPLPYPVVINADSNQIARFEEQSSSVPGVDLDIQSIRSYPYQATAAHLLGELKRDSSSAEGEDSFFSYRLPDYRGVLGIEYGFDSQLRGRAGGKSVVVNSVGYRQTESIILPATPGSNVVLTIDLAIQQAAEHALQQRGPYGADTRAAAVVMQVQTGDILALASSPTYNPNSFAKGLTQDEWNRMQKLTAEKNRGTGENYAPGSIFKTVVAMACLENGLDPKSIYEVQPNPRDPRKGVIYVGRRAIGDTVPPGAYDFCRALIRSSNSYFITNGLHAGVENVVKFGKRLHLGESIGLTNRQETAGIFPGPMRIRSGWSDGDTANLCIGQGEIAVSPLQMAVLASALGNGGKVLWPRFVDRLEPQDPLFGGPTVFPKGLVRDNLGLKASTLKIIDDAMLRDVEDQTEGTGRLAFVPDFRICSKTGTAQVMNQRNEVVDLTTWFLSYAPHEKPRYAVVVMVESGGSGGTTCAPIAHDIYLAIQEMEKRAAPPQHTGGLARTN